MAKKVTHRTILGDKGIALIHRRVLDMEFVWHQRAIDAGIDGEIELRDAASEAVLNRVILVQSKALSRFNGETDDGFHYYCKARDRDYWLQANVPVILVCSRPDDDEAYWVHVQDWFSTPGRRASTRIDFDKQRDRFDRSAAERLLQIGADAEDVGTAISLPRTETLISNLLAVEKMPERIFSAPSKCRDSEAWERMGAAEAWVSDWILCDSRIYSFRDPSETAAVVLCEGPTTSFATTDWSESGDSDITRRFVWLLNSTLRESHHRDLLWHNGRQYLYVRPSHDLRPRKFRSGTGKRTRTVFNTYLNKKDSRKVAYFRHDAFSRRFVRFDDRWYLEIVPTYHYTYDGKRESHYAAEYLRKIKARERNAAVRDQLRMWARYLRGEETLLDRSPRLLGFGQLLTFDVASGINDESWKAPKDADTAEDSLRLFGDAG